MAVATVRWTHQRFVRCRLLLDVADLDLSLGFHSTEVQRTLARSLALRVAGP